MQLRALSSIHEVPAQDWNSLGLGDNPFIRHEFLAALETHGCASAEQGWTPHHLVASLEGAFRMATPLYIKTHSFGEFVFDWSWAEASHRLGRNYYPKLLCAVPFNPVTGPRLLADEPALRIRLAETVRDEAEALGLSSAHALFLEERDRDAFREAGYLLRRDCQFRWHNRGYTDFDGFLASLNSEQRKKIRRERRRVSEAGIRIALRNGSDLRERDWQTVFRFYSHTYHERGQIPYLTLECLLAIAEKLGPLMRIFMAYDGNKPVGAAIMFACGETLYGRHWGCDEHYHSLHFETCYYAGIEYCIREGLTRFDAGAQGEHKLHRGFDPVLTWSAHWISDPRLSSAVASFLQREGSLVDAYVTRKSRPAVMASGSPA